MMTTTTTTTTVMEGEEAKGKVSPLMDLPTEMWFEVMSNLTYSDLKELRLVSQHFQTLVDRFTVAKPSKIIVTGRNLLDIMEHVESGKSRLCLDNIELRNLHESKDIEKFLALIGKDIKHLKLSNAQIMRGTDPLLFEPRIVNIETVYESNEPVSSEHIVQGVNLQQFMHLGIFETDNISLHLSFRRLTKYLCSSMGKIRLRRLCFEYNSDMEDMALEMVKKYAEALEYLDIYFSTMPNWVVVLMVSALKRMDRLHTLKLAGQCSNSVLQLFIDAVPKNAPIRDFDMCGMVKLSNETLMRAAVKFHRTLESLNLGFCVELDGRCVDALQYLSGSLRYLRVGYCQNLTTCTLLKGLTPQRNFILQELHLSEFALVSEITAYELMKRLPNLRKLSLGNCRNAGTDFVLTGVFRYQKQLEELNIDYCVRVTDAGLLGEDAQPTGLRAMNSLRVLKMRGCCLVTDRVFVEANRMPELRKISIGYCHQFTIVGIKALVEKFPSVENLCLASGEFVSDDIIYNVIKNLKRLRLLNISNCFRITHQTIKIMADHGSSLTQVTACGLDIFNINSEQILQASQPQLCIAIA